MEANQIAALRARVQDLEAENERLRTLASRWDGSASSGRNRYRTLFDSMDEGFCIIEFFDGPHGELSDYVHIEANAAYARHAGIPNVVGQKVREMVPDEAGGWVELYRNVLVTGTPIRFERELVATGRHLALSAFRIEPVELKQVAVLFQDVSPRKQAEAALQQLNETLERRVAEAIAERRLFADVFERTNAYVQVIDHQYRWLAINSSASLEFGRIFGRTPQIGDNILDLTRDDPASAALLHDYWARALAGEEFVEVSGFEDPAGKVRHYEMRFSGLRGDDGALIGAYQFSYDVTERLREQEQLRSTEAALRQSQKMEAVGQLTGGIAHDFNNMLAVIMSSLKLAQRRMDRGNNDIGEYLGSAMGGAKRAANLVARLLSFSRQQPLSPQSLDANALLGGMEDVLLRTIPESIKIEMVRSAGLWRMLADPHSLENVLVNLAVNARDAMPGGGKLTIETANAFLDDAYTVEHQDLMPGQYVMIAVTDSGHGMSPDVIARAFEPFFTTKEVGSGTGLGLSQVYGFAKQSKGHVKIYSEVGIGTTVKLYIPRLVELHDAKPVTVQRAAPIEGDGKLVLVVEDDDDVRRLSVDILRELGYKTLSASNGRAALSLIADNPDLTLLMTDVVMPEMNGRQLADKAAAMRPGLNILFTTGYTRNAIVHNGALDEGVELIAKPFTFEDLAAKLSRMLR